MMLTPHNILDDVCHQHEELYNVDDVSNQHDEA